MPFSFNALRSTLSIAVLVGGFTCAAAMPSLAQSDDKTVAVVNGDPIKQSELVRFFQDLPKEVQGAGMQGIYPLLLEEVIGRHVIAEKARAAGVQKDPELQERLKQVENELLYNYYVIKEAEKQVDDAAVRARYDELVAQQPQGQEIDVSHILVDTEEEAKEIIKEITAGKDFAELAKERSKDPGSASNGGSYGWSRKGQYVKPFEDAAFSLEPNTFTSEPVKTQFGWHIILVKDKRDIQPPAFEEVAPRIREQLAETKVRGIIQEAIKGATVERFDMDGNPMPTAQ
ncbi:MAG: peptidylprolyl isomerase [Alphaproteobacteria bacterium]|nr:peptidylprolyl isomerase [Alphaproteobacteria bacterium]